MKETERTVTAMKKPVSGKRATNKNQTASASKGQEA
jgi:hypothetical protein